MVVGGDRFTPSSLKYLYKQELQQDGYQSLSEAEAKELDCMEPRGLSN
jgi:hypothetical protein